MGSNDRGINTFYRIYCKRFVLAIDGNHNWQNHPLKKEALKIEYNPRDRLARVIDDILSFVDGCFLLQDNVIESLVGNMGGSFFCRGKSIYNRF
jgi:hypothetical protein